jgi:LmbE family N-acetylglucosaminyl deacetylase
VHRVVLSVLAHPDDAEILCGGVLILLARASWKVHVATMTPGDCGSSELPPDEIAAIRRVEAARAASLLGGDYHCVEERDLRIHYEPGVVARVTGLIQRVRPDIIITHSPADYMVDHEETSRITRAASFNAPIPNAPVADLPGLDAHAGAGRFAPCDRIPALYYADPIGGTDTLGQPIQPRAIVDITEVIERKAELLACHASQREWLRRHHGIDEYIDGMRSWGRERGALAGVAFGEGFRQHLGHAYPTDDALGDALGHLHHSIEGVSP